MIKFFAGIIVLFNLIIIPVVVSHRIYKHRLRSFLNPLLFLVVGSYCYMTLGSAFLFQYSVPGWEYSYAERALTDLLSNYYTLVFFLAYFFSRDYENVEFSFSPSRMTSRAAMCCVAVITPLFIFLIATNFSQAISCYGDRGAAHLVWSSQYEKFRVGMFNNIYMAAVCVLVWRKNNPHLFWLFLIPAIFPLMFNGKGDPLKFIVFAYINVVVIKKNFYLKSFSLGLIVLLLTGIVRLQENYGFLTIILGEFIAPRFSTDIVFYEMRGEGNLQDLLKSSICSMIPGQVSQAFLPQHDNYVYLISEMINIGWHIMGSPLGEALYYGGFRFALITPFIVALFYITLNRMKLYRTLPGFIFLIFMVLHLQLMMREGFFAHLFAIVYLMFSYLLWITLPEGLLRDWHRTRPQRISF